MADADEMKWWSVPAAALFVAVTVLFMVLLHNPVVSGAVRWTFTIIWLCGGLFAIIWDRVLHKGTVDVVAVDYWTAVHAGFGVVAGFWYFPLIPLLVVTIAWEFFEASVPGFGMKEKFWNRFWDVAVAVAGWFLIVIIVIVAEGAGFPLLAPQTLWWNL